MKRVQERENASLLIYQYSINSYSADELLEIAAQESDIEIDDFVQTEVRGVCENIAAIDEMLNKNCTKWDIKRISKIALAAMRIACYEILFDESIPVSVSINEAVNFTKKYAGEENSAFINGVLGGVAKNKA